jgi:hypothetical protein
VYASSQQLVKSLRRSEVLNLAQNTLVEVLKLYPHKTGEQIVSPKRKFTLEEARRIGEFQAGRGVELEHGARDLETNVTDDDEIKTGKIALAHLREFPDYYTRLAKMEQEAEEYWENNR